MCPGHWTDGTQSFIDSHLFRIKSDYPEQPRLSPDFSINLILKLDSAPLVSTCYQITAFVAELSLDWAGTSPWELVFVMEIGTTM